MDKLGQIQPKLGHYSEGAQRQNWKTSLMDSTSNLGIFFVTRLLIRYVKGKVQHKFIKSK